MKTFLHENFMLKSETAQILYHETAAALPIIDYHCHIDPKDIAENKQYKNLAEIWLTCGDHYKWRAIRANGYAEKYVTGDADDYDKFKAWANTLPKCIGSPLYIWAHTELKKYFGYGGVLNAGSCDLVWNLGLEKLKSLRARDIIKQSNVKLICTTDDPADTLEFHKAIAADQSFKTAVLPAFRPDKGLHIEKPGFAAYLEKLGEAANFPINSFDDLCGSYIKRLDYFAAAGCKTADNGFENIPFRRGDAGAVLKKALSDGTGGLSQHEIDIYKTELFLFLAREYRKRGFVMQIHFGVGRNYRDRLFDSYGPDAGGDGIGGFNCIQALSKILNELDKTDELTKTVLYSINPVDNTALTALMGCFQTGGPGIFEGGTGKMQHGSAWWFNDTNKGMREQLTGLADGGLLANFVGMLTDSRSFLSYTRHDYFRRILCDVLGDYAEAGEYPRDIVYLSEITKNICYNNTRDYFGFDL
ncbi:MAG: glucuronate isomerase [Oscillospiraceae bacterium]|nr:glucuronate isomerase [Oscillospiraceae bacterium]